MSENIGLIQILLLSVRKKGIGSLSAGEQASLLTRSSLRGLASPFSAGVEPIPLVLNTLKTLEEIMNYIYSFNTY